MLRTRRTLINAGLCVLSVTFLHLGFGSSSIKAAEASRLDLTECRARTLTNAPEIALAAADMESAALGTKIADRAFLPTLSGEGSYLRSSVDRRGVPDFAANNGENEYIARAVVSQPLYLGGSLHAGREKARAERAAAGHAHDMARASVLLETDAAYFGLLAAEQQHSIASAAQAISEELLRAVRVRHQNGEVSAFDVGKFDLEVAQAKVAADAAATNVAIARSELAVLVGLPADGLEVVPPPSPDGESTIAPLDGLLAQALDMRPDLRRLESEAQSLESAVRIARAARLPQVRSEAALGYDSLALPDSHNDGWQAGLNVTLPIWDWGTLEARERVARLEVEKARQRLVAARRAITNDVTRRYLEAGLARQQLTTSTAAERLARENTETARRGYELGLVSTLDLITAQHQATQVASQRAAAESDYHLALSRLDFAAGRLR